MYFFEQVGWQFYLIEFPNSPPIFHLHAVSCPRSWKGSMGRSWCAIHGHCHQAELACQRDAVAGWRCLERGAPYPTWGHVDNGTCRWRDPQPLLGRASGAKIQGSSTFPILSHWCFRLSAQDLHEQALDTFGGRGWRAEFSMQWGEENQVFDQCTARTVAQQYSGPTFQNQGLVFCFLGWNSWSMNLFHMKTFPNPVRTMWCSGITKVNRCDQLRFYFREWWQRSHPLSNRAMLR